MNGENIFLCGAAEINITPPLGSVINGEFLPRFAKGIHDEIYAKALVFCSRGTWLVMVVIDTCAVSAAFTKAIQAEVSKKTEIPASNIIIAATHIHSGGSLTEAFLTEADKSYQQKVGLSISDAVTIAIRNMQPAKIAYGSINVPEHVVCRRYRMKPDFKPFDPFSKGTDKVVTNPFGHESEIISRTGSTDPELYFLAIKSHAGEWISLLANYSLHYVGDFDPQFISADYFGLFAGFLAKELDASAGFVGIMSNGTSGNVNIWDFIHPDRYPSGPFEKSTMIANDLVKKIKSQLDGLTWEEQPEIHIETTEISCKIQKPSTEEFERAKLIFDKTDYTKLLSYSQTTIEKVYAREQLLLNKGPDNYNIHLSAIKIGGLYIGTVPGELFAETGLWLKEKMAPNAYFTISLANDSFGYAPPNHELEMGGYESWRCRTSKLERGAENAIREKLIYMLNNIKK